MDPKGATSSMVTTVSLVAPLVTPEGGAPSLMLTVSPWSPIRSETAENSKDFSVSPALKVTSVGTPLWSESDAPSSLLQESGMVTVRSGSSSRVSTISTVPPSVTV